MQFCKDNYRRTSGQGSEFRAEYDKPKGPFRDYFTETCTTAEIIYEQRTAPLYLAYSGGLDSEFALCTFRHLGIPIRPVIMRNQYNHHDTDYAIKFCTARNIDYDVIPMDFDQFVESGEMLEINLESEMACPEAATILWTVSQIDGTVVTGDAPPFCRLDRERNVWVVDDYEWEQSEFTFWNKRGILGTPYFMAHTANQWYSFLSHWVMQDLCAHRRPGKLTSNSSKIDLYNDVANFGLEARTKFTGFERILQSPIYNHPDMQTVISWKPRWDGWYEQDYYTAMEGIVSR